MMNNVRNAALVKETALKNDLISDSTRASLIRRANSMMAGEMVNQIRNRRHVTRSVIAEMLNFAKELGIYPIRGGTLSRKTSLISGLLLNNSKVFKAIFRN